MLRSHADQRPIVDTFKVPGVAIVSEPHDVPDISRRFAFFADPWGDLFELIEVMAD